MKKIELTPVPHNVKIGDQCGQITPNVTEDCIFTYEGQAVGFYLRSLTDKGQQLANIANHELRSKNVPKSEMRRSSGLRDAKAEVAAILHHHRQRSTKATYAQALPNHQQRTRGEDSTNLYQGNADALQGV
jgi:hypothetical protein